MKKICPEHWGNSTEKIAQETKEAIEFEKAVNFYIKCGPFVTRLYFSKDNTERDRNRRAQTEARRRLRAIKNSPVTKLLEQT